MLEIVKYFEKHFVVERGFCVAVTDQRIDVLCHISEHDIHDISFVELHDILNKELEGIKHPDSEINIKQYYETTMILGFNKDDIPIFHEFMKRIKLKGRNKNMVFRVLNINYNDCKSIFSKLETYCSENQ